MLSSLPGLVGLEEAVRRAIRKDGDDPLARLAARLPGSNDGRVWKGAYARSTDRLAALNRFLAAHPETLEAVLAGQRARATRDHGQELALGWVLNLMARYQLAAESDGPDLLLIDEGFSQRAAAIFGHGFSPEDHEYLTRYLEAIPPPRAVVVVEAPLETCLARLEARGWSERVADLDSEQKMAFLRSTNFVVTAVAAELEERCVRVIRVDGTAPAGTAVADVKSRLDL
jgi:hypothetical protein